MSIVYIRHSHTDTNCKLSSIELSRQISRETRVTSFPHFVKD